MSTVTQPNNTTTNHPTEGTAVGNGHSEKVSNGNGNHYDGQGYQSAQGGQDTGLNRSLTPGGHVYNDDLIIAGSAHRTIANPLPLGAYSFATTTLCLSLYNLGVQGIAEPNAVLTFSLFYGGLTQYLAGLWEFASGNTFGATVFVCFGMFWWGFSMIFIPFFGEMGTYNGQPGVYAEMGLGGAEAANAIGLFLWIWFGITTLLLLAAIRSSIAIVSLLFVLDLTFAMLGAHYYTGNAQLLTAGGALGVVTAFIAYYIAAASMLTKQTSYFTLPLGSLAVKD